MLWYGIEMGDEAIRNLCEDMDQGVRYVDAWKPFEDAITG